MLHVAARIVVWIRYDILVTQRNKQCNHTSYWSSGSFWFVTHMEYARGDLLINF